MIVIVDAVRTAMGGFQGSLASCTAPDLGAVAIQHAVARAGLSGTDIDEVIFGCVLPAGLKQGPARQAMRQAGLPDSTGATTINKICGSGMKAVMQAADAIQAGSAQIVVAGGMESMSNAPYLLDKARAGFRMGHGKVTDHMFQEGLEDAETGLSMGVLAQDMADKKNYTREQQDEYAIRSLNRAVEAIQNGYFKNEIVPVTVHSRKGDVIVDQDEQPLNAKVDKISSLRPAFKKDGTITAANASSISDGASALVITSDVVAAERGLKPLAKVVAYATHSQHPSEFTLAPVGAIQKVLDKAGWSVADVDLWEINEAFAMVTMLAIDAFDLDPAKVNIQGGACALGHPLGSSGSRIIVTLIHALQRIGAKKGVASLCIGGGEATAIAVELV
ncbi:MULTISPECIES: thiolase family protein [Acinetobacter]|jgi:acetyl-CoA C-acetyltransferase|uniref:Beta-ketoadipyl-CoA thiolase n=1 Tax=Acinetobacter towneri TaxID=202956 RepID=A0AAP9KJ59_9GAMM|nr:MULTISPECIES: thiolase family protein [Acinetobacter]GIT83604.1 acetyl-CoA acetyltransferase [Acinetobacter seohaensis]AVH48617.1 thiolase family protein [Acinetobacter sp. SWBY1]MBT0887438.1 thiolase family protein [Acinetobacter towneri]MCA4779336.1 thiolase family protein [Acinetobacter towneri]MCA4784663.1 thiolase family protein [Acinetobacter towneri]